jgi:hypothetical protein
MKSRRKLNDPGNHKFVDVLSGWATAHSPSSFLRFDDYVIVIRKFSPGFVRRRQATAALYRSTAIMATRPVDHRRPAVHTHRSELGPCIACRLHNCIASHPPN